jgi:hypothetical protein
MEMANLVTSGPDERSTSKSSTMRASGVGGCEIE